VNEEQWDWLTAQAAEYLELKGTKDTPKFWGPFFNEWQNKWPTPALTDSVHGGGGDADESPASTGEPSASTSESPASSGDSANTVGAKAAKATKSKKMLTLQRVCAVTCHQTCIDMVMAAAAETVHEQSYMKDIIRQRQTS
jgi:hypothetical protein